MLRYLHGVQFLNIVLARVIVVMDIRVHIVAIQIFREIDDLLQTARMIAHFQSLLKLFILVPAHFIKLRCQIIQLVQAFILAQLVIDAVHIRSPVLCLF